MVEELAQYAPKYRVIAEELRQQIVEGQYQENQGFPSELELVKQYEVSRATVRGALEVLVEDRVLYRQRGRGTFVAPHQGQIQSTTLVFSHADAYSMHHPYLSRLYQGFEGSVREHAQNNGRKVSVQCIRQPKAVDRDGFTLLRPDDAMQAHAVNPHYVQGLCLTSRIPRGEVAEVQRRGIACVRVGGRPVPYVPTVFYDHLPPVQLALDHLVRLGHRDIGWVTTLDATTEGDERLSPEIRILAREAGVNVRDEYNVVCGDYKREEAFGRVMKLMGRADRPSALCCNDDFLALGARDAAGKLGLAVPGDVSIVGLGDYVPDANLTSVSLPLAAMGRAAAAVLIELVSGRYDGTTKIEVGGAELFERGSTGKVAVEKG